MTDIITFNYSEEKKELKGDIYISIDRIRENAKTYKTTFVNELHRVIIHGILHLLGFGDREKKEKERMKRMEEKNLKLFDVICYEPKHF